MMKTGVRVWDWPTRAFHWLLVATILCAWLSHRYGAKMGDPTLIWHRWNGYAILVLVVFRLFWGFVGSSTSRFSRFVHGPVFVLGYARDFISGNKRHFLGHNPLGTLMVLVLLATVLAQGVLGLFTLEHNEIVAGPLKRLLTDEMTEKVSKLHVRGLNYLIVLVAIHVLANAAYGFLAKDPLIKAMVTGRKPAADYEDEREARIPSNITLRAFLTLAAAIAVVFGGIMLAGGRIF
ncbi:MAG TPA: cytochrome b/b6 domain-containing protein [Rhabdaerophilum sp.]|nr:cytochrome b/b6 domain-containing protein [Rhabdaerophilum sp.]